MTHPNPFLFLDVDGPLIPFGGPAREFSPSENLPNPLLARVNPALGPRLLSLGCDLVWATTWMADANDCLSPLLGLPDLPVLTWPDSEDDDTRLHWKTPAIVAHAAGRPFVWVDDEITGADRTWVVNHHPGPALLHAVPPSIGLTAHDLDDIATWLREPGITQP
ncbi:HAD domain-containing protein [Actinophytocola xanthii]|uniref:Secreted protein n=1 Tax=Actinophytocola xanthii TaxID=1912961 RepID=A0A1Q8CWZ1_9PSEU|nr:HAD domain-containing protein [Actinophytocola xanthii]OLF18877.1 hypothetical protein BU204_03165 [Actinophytocola xanthii]